MTLMNAQPQPQSQTKKNDFQFRKVASQNGNQATAIPEYQTGKWLYRSQSLYPAGNESGYGLCSMCFLFINRLFDSSSPPVCGARGKRINTLINPPDFLPSLLPSFVSIHLSQTPSYCPSINPFIPFDLSFHFFYI